MRKGLVPGLIVFLLTFVAFLGFGSLNKVSAVGQCQITLNDVSIGAISVDVGAQQSIDPTFSYYPVKVCGDLSQAVGKKLRVAMSYNIDGSLFWSNWTHFDLSPVTTVSANSCSEGVIKLDLGGGKNATAKININIENGPDICQTTWAHLLSTKAGNVSEWSSAQQQMCNSFDLTPKDKIGTNTNLVFTLNFPPAITSSIKDGYAYDPLGTSEKYYVSVKNQGGEAVYFREFNLFTGIIQAELKLNAGTDIANKPGAAGVGATYTASISRSRHPHLSFEENYCSKVFNFVVGTPANPGSASSGNLQSATFDLCKQANVADTVRCNRCLCGKIECEPKDLQTKPPGIWTAVGCIPSTPQGIVQSLLRVGLGMAGGVVVLSVLAGAFMLATSSGEPKKVQEAQELISSAIIGLLFVVFSVIILQFIGVQILRLPGFGSPGTAPPPTESIQ